MPYNTRRKSLSLPALGIQLPPSSRVYRAALPKPAGDADPPTDAPPAKRVKRAHGARAPDSPPPSAVSPPPVVKSVTFADRPASRRRPAAYAHTPPPSPGGAASPPRIDVEGIKDDIVVGVIEQLETTGNRPHLIKELATVLSTTHHAVTNSANPAALLSSRLAAYMRRPWTALAPCPIAKELIPVHPRKVFYYLTTTPRQALPASPAGRLPGKRIISPSLSNASQDDDDATSPAEDYRQRAALSPSPEIDLSLDLGEAPAPVPEGPLPDFPTPGSSLGSSRSSQARDEPERDLGLNRRAESPALEGDEREFTATARDMRRRGRSGSPGAGLPRDRPGADGAGPGAGETEEEGAAKNSEAARALFGPQPHATAAGGTLTVAAAAASEAGGPSSPLLTAAGAAGVKAEVEDVPMEDEWAEEWAIGRPENMDLDELDDFFEGY